MWFDPRSALAEIRGEPLARDVAAAKAKANALAGADGVARTPEAIEAVWDWAEARARHHTSTRKDFDE
jgi:hypothetical protein